MSGASFTPFLVLKTERLVLRQPLSTDDKEIFALRSNENVNEYLGRKPSKSIDDAKSFIKVVNENTERNNSIYWAIVLSSNNKLIGTICLYNFSEDNTKAEIGFELLPDFQGKGIMQEATRKVINVGFQHFGLYCIEAHTHLENQRSVRLLEKFNFKSYGNGNNNVIVFKLTADD